MEAQEIGVEQSPLLDQEHEAQIRRPRSHPNGAERRRVGSPVRALHHPRQAQGYVREVL